MSSPLDDEAADDPVGGSANTAGAPAPSYPRGNRLGLRHPRPTVVIVVALIVLLGGAFAWQLANPPEGVFCSVVGAGGTPLGSTPEDALAAWYDGSGAQQASRLMSEARGTPTADPSLDDFEPYAEGVWMWRIDDDAVRVDVGPGYRVTAVNDCGFIRD